jgi:hypothetical protein
MTAKICAKCQQWRRGNGGRSGMCVRHMMVTGAADTCTHWAASGK